MYSKLNASLCGMMNESKTFSISTLGCKVNQYESMAAKSLLTEAGYIEAEDKEVADVVIINTCTVTHVADKKSRQTIRRIISKNKNATVLVMGCYAQMKPEEVEQIDGVDIVIGTEGKSQIAEILNNYFKANELPVFESSSDSFILQKYEEIVTNYQPDKTRAFIKVQDGCNLFCTYCIIPYARGKIRSRNINDILKEVKFLAKSGYREIVLTGIHLSSFGLDCKDKNDDNYDIRLINLIERIAEDSPDIRIRLGSLEPGIVTEDFAKRIAKVPSICDQFHLSLQSGSDTILKLMNRRYDTVKYRQAVDNLRAVFDKPAISSDVIVGFPSETDELFKETMAFCESIGFANLHVFPYSPRENTPASKMPNQIEKKVKTARVNQLIDLANKMEIEYLHSLVGTTQEIIVENYDGSILSGRCRNYAPVYMEFDQNKEQIYKKNILKCKISAFDNKKLRGVYHGLSIL